MVEGGRLILAVFVTAAAWTDVRRGKIYNLIILPTLAAGLLLVFADGSEKFPGILTAALLTIVCLYPFWRLGGLGAGDIKMFLALIPLMGVQWYFCSFVLSFLIGGAAAVILLIIERDRGAAMHFAVPVGISVLICLILDQAGVNCPEIL